MKRILLSHGGGGEQTWELIRNLFLRHLGNELINPMEDSTLVNFPSTRLAVTTDAFTVKPLFFRGGNIGKLAVAGTVNDLAVAGARPLYITLSFIIEEGFSIDELKEIVRSVSEEAKVSDVKVVAGDTKVVPRGQGDGLFISATGIGEVVYEGISAGNLKEGDVIIVSGTVGDHGACILAQREGIEMETEIRSDCASLWPVIKEIIKGEFEIHAMRDPTRGGLSAVLYEWAYASGVSIVIDEDKVPVKEEVLGLCELLGLEPLHLACEGRFVVAVPRDQAGALVRRLREFDLTRDATSVGEVVGEDEFPKVIVRTSLGTERLLEPPSGELLPRIC